MEIMSEIVAAISNTVNNNPNFQDIKVKITLTNENGTKENRDFTIKNLKTTKKEINDDKNVYDNFVEIPEPANDVYINNTTLTSIYRMMEDCVNDINKTIRKYNGLCDVTDMYLYSQAGGKLLKLIHFKERFETNYKIELSIDDKGFLNIEMKNV